MAYTVYTAAQATSRAKAVTSWPKSMCLGFVRHCLNGEKGVGLYDANEAWTRATKKETTGTPPAGAPVYFKGGAHGHIAISVGGGKVRSTDYRTGYGYTVGVVGTATINEVALEFFGTTSAYRGWSRDYAGLIIRGLEETNTNYSPPPVVPEEDDVTPAQMTQILNAIAAIPGKTWNVPLSMDPDGSGPRPTITSPAQSWVKMADFFANKAHYNTDSLEANVAALQKSVAALTAKVDKLLNS